MADVSKVRGERSPDEPTGPKKRKKPDKDFREMMKVGKVRETDPEEKRKRKKQAEAEEDMKAEQTASVPRQGMEPEPKEPAIFAPEPGEGPVGGPEGAEGPSAPPPYMPPEQEPEEPPQFPRERRTERKKERPPTAPEHKKKPEKAEKPSEKKKKKVTGPTPEMKKLKTAPTAPHKKEPTLEETEALFKKVGKPTDTEPEKKKKKKEPEEALPVPLPPGAWEATKAPEKKGKKEVGEPETLPTTTTPTPTAAPPPGTPAPPPLVAPFAHLSPQVQQVFERMVGVMTVMTDSGATQTTINLDNPRFAESVFFGAQIIVSEFSTAPKAFNIELLGNQQAMNLMTTNAEELVAAFQAGNYNFKVNRIDIGSLPLTGEAKRKKVSRVKRKKTGGG